MVLHYKLDAMCSIASVNGLLQVNQVQGMYIEDSDILHAGDNGVDFVAVQYGHICRTKIHDANWCIYAKGGPAVQIQGSLVAFPCRPCVE
jgi:hypothetical protein